MRLFVVIWMIWIMVLYCTDKVTHGEYIICMTLSFILNRLVHQDYENKHNSGNS